MGKQLHFNFNAADVIILLHALGSPLGGAPPELLPGKVVATAFKSVLAKLTSQYNAQAAENGMAQLPHSGREATLEEVK